MSENEDLKDCLRTLAEVVPQDARPAVQQRLLACFRERRNKKPLWAYLAGAAASTALVIGLYVALWRGNNAGPRVSATESDQTAGFIALPYAQSGVPLEQPVIVHVNIPVSELGAMGVPFTVNAAKESVSADLLVGQDGVARAVRFSE